MRIEAEEEDRRQKTEADCCEVQCTVREAIKKDQETRYNDEDLKPFQMEHCYLSVANGILLRGSRIVEPKRLQQKVVDTRHDGHHGIVKRKQLLRSSI